jgi:H+/Cl- antiporter ClcA
MGRTYDARTNGLVLMAVILAGLASLGLLGNYSYFGVAQDAVSFARDGGVVIACGVVGGALGAIFSASVLWATRRIRRWTAIPTLWRTVLIAAVCGFLVAIIGVTTGGMTFGTGYEQARSAVEGVPLPWYFFVGKFVAGVATAISGIPGGIFAPSLSVGAGIGSVLGVAFGSSAGISALLGMAGYFAGVVQAPMTAFVIILEMTGTQDNVIALMSASMLGYGTARLISREPLYHALARIFIADAIRRRRAETTASSP